MIYKLETGNYKSFEKFSDNLLLPRSYFIPFSSVDAMKGCDIRNERYSSDMVECLSGEWDFIYYDNCKALESDFDTDKINFDKVSVPSTWQHTGYEKPYYVNIRYQFKPEPPHIPENCPVGVYRRFIDITDNTSNYTISFLGVAGSLDLFCNGKYVGYSEGSHNTAQFELNDFIVEGKNEIVVVNHKWCNGTYLECQDMFRCNGIFRDVLLYKTGNNSIYDFYVETACVVAGKNSVYDFKLIPSMKLVDECELGVALFDDGELIASVTVNQSPKMAQAIELKGLEVKQWSAECPYLYDMVLTLTVKGEVVEVIHKQIGFKLIEIVGTKFLFNNEPIKLLGVNHHDTNSKTGYVLTIEEMERDIKLIKQFNANCIRTSHYPPDPVFLDLCDEYGIYVVDEADIETHGMNEIHKINALSNDEKWTAHYWDRVYRMYERDKNHPCITMWSLGNESGGYKCHDYCYNELKKQTDIPIHYEAACRTRRWSYDVLSQMYTFPQICEKIAKGSGLPSKYYKKPFYLCEYAHAMGVGAGELERYVNCFYSSDIMLGGCIWEFVDHAIYHENGRYEYTYGGDHGEEKHDGNFCVDGLFYPDRAPHSGAYQMKACYRPVRVTDENKGTFTFKNHRYFENADFTVIYTVLENGEVSQTGDFELDIPPQKTQNIKLDINVNSEKNTYIQFEYLDGDFSVAEEEIELAFGSFAYETTGTAPKLSVSEKRLFIEFNNGSMIFDTKTGFIDSYMIGDKELINQIPFGDFKGLGISLYRAPLDNDMYISKLWKAQGLDTASSVVKNVEYKLTDHGLDISYITTIKSHKKFKVITAKTMLTVFSNGEIMVTLKALSDGSVKLIPRFGIQLELNKEFKNVKYYGLGPYVNLPDFKEHTLMGLYETTVDDMYENYIKPQESATRCNTKFAEITDDDGTGIRIEDFGGFVFSAKPFTSQECAKAMHRENLVSRSTVINIDGEIMGAGSNSCGPPPSKEYRLGKLRGKSLSFVIKPIGD